MNLKRKSQRWLALGMAACALGTTLMACQDDGGEKPSSQATESKVVSTRQEESNFNEEGLPVVNEEVTLEVLTTRWGNMGDSFKQNQWLIDLEERTNVIPNWEVQSLNDWGEQKSIMLNSDVLPDVFLGSNTLDDKDIINNSGFFLGLDDYIEKYMPRLSEAFKELPEFRKVCTSLDGHIYSLPRKLPKRPITCNQPIINKKWLDNLSLEVPETIDELTTVLRAFKEQDANGNGDPSDEFAISGAKGLSMDLLNPFGITDLNGKKILVDGDELTYYPTSEGYKEGLKWLRTLYEEGIIDPESFTQDGTMQDAKRKNEAVALVGFDYAWSHDALFGQWSDEYIAIAPIAGPDGKRYAAGDVDGVGSIQRNEMLISRNCEQPEVAARWADEFYTGEASIQNFWGAIDTVITKNDDGTYSLNDPPEGTSADSWYWDQSLRDFGPKYVSAEFEPKIHLSPESGDGLKLEMSKLGEEYVTTPYPNVMFTVEEADQLAMLTTDIDKYIDVTRAEWITNGGIDEGWDDYVKQLEDMGLEDLLTLYREAFDRYNAE